MRFVRQFEVIQRNAIFTENGMDSEIIYTLQYWYLVIGQIYDEHTLKVRSMVSKTTHHCFELNQTAALLLQMHSSVYTTVYNNVTFLCESVMHMKGSGSTI